MTFKTKKLIRMLRSTRSGSESWAWSGSGYVFVSWSKSGAIGAMSRSGSWSKSRSGAYRRV